jgi:hypothetical protein
MTYKKSVAALHRIIEFRSDSAFIPNRFETALIPAHSLG